MAKRRVETQQTKQAQTPVQEENPRALIAQKAHELYEGSGRVEGRDLENWLEAERLIRQTCSSRR